MARYVYPFVAQTSYHNFHWDGGLAVDVFGPLHSAILACTDGRTEVENFSLGGHTVTLHGDDGRHYYYAHLVQGSGVQGRVAAGEKIGEMNNTGNAANTDTHCHFAAGSPGWVNQDGSGDLAPWTLLNEWRGQRPTAVTMAQLAANLPNPHLVEQRASWGLLRQTAGQDPNDWAAFREFQRAIGAPDPGDIIPVDFPTSVVTPRPRGLTLATLADELPNPNIRNQRMSWGTLRRNAGEDPNDWTAFRQFQIAIRAPDPGPREPVDFRSF